MKKNLLSVAAISLLLLSGTALAKTLNLACMRSATETRENAFLSTWNTYASSIKIARETRRDGLKSAWDITSESQRETSIKTVEKNYKDAVKISEDQRKNSEKSAKKTYKTAAKSCKQ